MPETPPPSRVVQGIVVIAGLIIILAGLKVAASLIVPFLMSAFIALLSTAPLFWLNRKGIPNGLSVVLILIALLGVGTVLGVTVGASVNSLSRNLPEYRASLRAQSAGLVEWMTLNGLDVGAYEASLNRMLDPSAAMGMAGGAIKKASGVLTNGFMILLTVVFILLEAGGMPNKLGRVLAHPEKTLTGFRTFVDSVKQYLLIKSVVSAITGVLAGIATAIIGVDFPILWGVLAFAFNFVPTIGSFIAAVPPILLGMVQFGPSAALSVGAAYVVINVLMGNIIEPRLTGQGLGLSPLVVFLSLVFWGWVLGPVGMLLSVPLTMIVKIACESSDNTRHISVILGP